MTKTLLFQQGAKAEIDWAGSVQKSTTNPNPKRKRSDNELGGIRRSGLVWPWIETIHFELVRLSGEMSKAAQRLSVRSFRKITE